MKQYQIDRIKDLMDAKGVSSKELASKCGLSEMTIRRVLDPKHNPTTDNIEKISEALGVHEQYIYEAEGESMPIQPVTGYIEYGGTIIKKYRTVIFDFDGTLVDTRPLFKYRYLIKGKSRWNDPEGFQKAYKEFSEHLKDCKPFDGIVEVLQFIKENNITAYIVTGGNKGKAEDAIRLFGWEGVFKGAIGRFSVNNTKKITKARP